MAVPLRSVVINPVKTHTATVLFLHGLGDSGYGWKSVGEMLAPLLPNVKWVFPHAPSIKVTLNFGQTMPAWYDIYSLDKSIKKQDEAGILQSVTSSYFCFDIVEQLIANEINSGIQSERIIVGGFSQGAAISLLTGLLSQFKLGGIICLSGYLPISEKVDALKTSANDKTKYFMAHGDMDQVVACKWGEESCEKLKSCGLDVQFKIYTGLGHSANDSEISDVASFLTSRIS